MELEPGLPYDQITFWLIQDAAKPNSIKVRGLGSNRVTPGNYTDATTEDYPVWHARRGSGFLAPKVYGPDLPIPMTDDAEDIRMEIEARYELTDQLRAENSTLSLENKRLKGELKKSKKRARGFRKYINSIHLTETIAAMAKEMEELQNDNITLKAELDVTTARLSE